MKRWFAAAACAVVLAASGSASANVLALSPLASGGFGNPIGLNLGWSFQVTVPVKVTALAYFEDSDPDPLQGSHTVGIWADGDGANPLAIASVDPGDTVIDIPLSNGTQHFYVQTIAGVVLTPGNTYVVSGTPNGADTIYQAPFFTLGAEILFVSDRYGSTPGGYAESGNGSVQAWLGGNFLYELADVAAAPEPGTLALLLGPLAAIAWRRRARC